MAQVGYSSRLIDFLNAENADILNKLNDYVVDAGSSQIKAWRDLIAILKRAVGELFSKSPHIDRNSSIILEYTIPMESRRIDAVLLLNGLIVVLEFKGKSRPLQADVDQAAAYARDLRAYHKVCSSVPVKCFLVLVQGKQEAQVVADVVVVTPESLARYCTSLMHQEVPSRSLSDFISFDSYRPLPSLIRAARELFTSGTLTRIHRAAMATEPTIDECSQIIHKTAQAKRRALILICGVPGAGKTLVGLQLAHAKYLDDLAVARSNGEKPTAPSVFLSGNGPLVEVLQYELRSAGDGKAFVRGVHEYVKTFTRTRGIIPPQHVLIYDEAQRAFDAEQVRAKHKDMPREFNGLSEPELFIQFAERVPEWCVVVGLIGSGQEIHIGEEAGLGQWRTAIEKAEKPNDWDIYLPADQEIEAIFHGLNNTYSGAALQLSLTIRFHLATRLYEFVEQLLGDHPGKAKSISLELEQNGYNLRITRNLEIAKQYLKDRYNHNLDARYGIVASARDRELIKYGVPKGFKSPGEVGPGKYGRWYSEPDGKEGSCTRLATVATEFGTQGLELDACLLAWGTDLVRLNGQWSNHLAARYQESYRIRDAKGLRINAYRVLLTRGRDGCVIFVPNAQILNETYEYLVDCGFSQLQDEQELSSVELPHAG